MRSYWGTCIDLGEGSATTSNYQGKLSAANTFGVRWRVPNTDTYRDRFLVNGETGNVVVAGNITANVTLLSSARRFKQNITPLDSSLSKINSLQGVTYTWDSASFPTRNFPSGQQIGLIAQDVEKILPQLVHTDADGYKSLSYDKLTAVLIEAVKELKAENKALSTIVSSQQENIGGLLQRIQSLEAKQ